MFGRRLAALLCLLALLAPGAAAVALGPDESTCLDGCCETAACADADCAEPAPCASEEGCPGEGDCPTDCPDCACSARARVAIPAGDAARFEPGGWQLATAGELALRPCDTDPREILHVPRG